MHAGCGQADLLMRWLPAPVLLPEGAFFKGACVAVTAG